MTDDPDIRMAQSMMDYIFRRLWPGLPALREAGGAGDLHRRGACRATQRVQRSRGLIAQPPCRGGGWGPRGPAVPRARGRRGQRAGSSRALVGGAAGGHHRQDGGRTLCTLTCGIKMRPAGSCYVCEGCGSRAAAADTDEGGGPADAGRPPFHARSTRHGTRMGSRWMAGHE